MLLALIIAASVLLPCAYPYVHSRNRECQGSP